MFFSLSFRAASVFFQLISVFVSIFIIQQTSLFFRSYSGNLPAMLCNFLLDRYIVWTFCPQKWDKISGWRLESDNNLLSELFGWLASKCAILWRRHCMKGSLRIWCLRLDFTPPHFLTSRTFNSPLPTPGHRSTCDRTRSTPPTSLLFVFFATCGIYCIGNQ